MNYNKTQLAGRLTRDVELKYTAGGAAVAELSLATNRKRKNKQGAYEDETTYVDVTLWGRTAELAGQYLSKGRPVFIEGRLHLDTWQDKQTGHKRSKLKVVGESMQFLGSGEKQSQSSDERKVEPPRTKPADLELGEQYLEDEEIPF